MSGEEMVDVGKVSWAIRAEVAWPDLTDGSSKAERVEGSVEVVAAWLRAVADQLSPPPRPTRPPHRGMAAPDEPFVVTRDGPRTLGRPTP